VKKFWRAWAKALGEKAGADDRESDKIALIRTVLVIINTVTCFFIIANAIHHW
jgi:hypothetical protein